MRKGINDLILEKQLDIQGRAVKKIGEILKGERPFASTQVDTDTRIEAVNNLGYLDMQDLVNEFGPDKIERLVYETKILEARKEKNA